MKALVLGAAGFIGRHISKSLAASGYVVLGLDRAPFPQSLSWGMSRFEAADVSKKSLSSFSNEQIDLFVNCVGSPSVGLSITHPAADFDLNVRVWGDILEFARLQYPKAHLILLSSAAVYGESLTLPNKISDTPHPVSPYGTHKRMAEMMGEAYSRNYGIPVSCVRFFSIFGEGLKRQLLWDALLKFEKNQPLFFGTGEEKRDWLHVEDAARLICSVAKNQVSTTTPRFSIFNGGSGQSYENKIFLKLLSESFGFNGSIDFNKVEKKGDPKEYRADLSSNETLSWAPKISIPEGVQRYVSWYKKEKFV